jgi:hypothetical protein
LHPIRAVIEIPFAAVGAESGLTASGVSRIVTRLESRFSNRGANNGIMIAATSGAAGMISK